MYRRIMVCLENSPTDEYIVTHVTQLAKHCGASVVLIHVADGWAARNIKALDLRESEEMREDRDYLDRRAAELVSAGLAADAVLATGEPAREISAAAEREGCDLIAMATHGHRLLGDVLHGSVATEVRHRSMIPVLLVRAPAAARKADPRKARAS